MPKNSLFGLVLSGGGARGAYEAGVLQFIKTQIFPKKNTIPNFDIYCGSSVGAINTCYLVSTAHLDPVICGNQLHQTWKDLKQDEIYLRDISAFTGFLTHALKGITLNLFRSTKKTLKNSGQHFNGFFNTQPFPKFIEKHINFKDLNNNVSRGPVKAISLTATNMHTDSMELFLRKKRDVKYTGPYPVHEVMIDTEHPMASAAIPIAFPPVAVGKYYYMDGGLRLNTPLSPAIQLGADKIFIIGLHNTSERLNNYALNGNDENINHYVPTLGDIMGKVLNSLFLDQVEYDLEQLQRINRIIDWAKMLYGDNFTEEINKMLLEKKIRGDVANRGLKELKVFSIFPSRDVREVFGDCLNDPKTYSKHFGSFEKLLLKVLDVDLIQGRDFLSYLMFLPNYLESLVELGYEDAKARKDEIEVFLSNRP